MIPKKVQDLLIDASSAAQNAQRYAAAPIHPTKEEEIDHVLGFIATAQQKLEKAKALLEGVKEGPFTRSEKLAELITFKKPNIGSYVLATKWEDGDLNDPWRIGFYHGNESERAGAPRHLVSEYSDGVTSMTIFRAVEVITQKEGETLLKLLKGDTLHGCGNTIWQILANLRLEDKKVPSNDEHS